MTSLRVLGTVLLVLGAPLAATADDACAAGGAPAVGIVQITGGDPEHTAYVDDRGVVDGHGAYVYLESNGLWVPKLPGVYVGDPQHLDLQRGERWCNGIYSWPLCAFDHCWDAGSYDVGPDYELFSW